MTIEFHCPSCQKLLRTSDDKAGATAKCPDCGSAAQVPHADDDYNLGGDVADDDFGNGFGNEDESDQIRGPRRGRSTSQSPPARSAVMKPCPMCGEQIRAVAVRCRYCGEKVDSEGYEDNRYAPRQQPTCGLAIASMVLGIVGLVTFCLWFITIPCSLLAVILGGVAMRQIKSRNLQGKGMAVAGLVCGALALVFCVIFFAWIVANFRPGRRFPRF